MEDFSEILQAGVQQFIADHLQDDLPQLLLKKSPFPGLGMQEIAQQIKGRQAAAKKFPFLNRQGIVFPPQLNLEQASSETAAAFKANLIKGKSMVDLTTGFGIDAYFLAKNFEQVTLVERHKRLLDTVRHNWNVLGRQADFVNAQLEDFLENTQKHFDLIFLDPARRDLANRKKFLLEDLSPDLLTIQDVLFEKADRVLVKLSPLIDLSYLISTLKHISKIYITGVKNEVKEVLLLLEKTPEHEGNPEITAVNLGTEEPEFCFNFKDVKTAKVHYGTPKRFLYIPNSSLLKTGAFNLISERFQIEKLHPNTQLYTSDQVIADFPGRRLEVSELDTRMLEKNSQFNIISRNYPLTPDGIKKKYKIRDGGNAYLIFTQSLEKKHILVSSP